MHATLLKMFLLKCTIVCCALLIFQAHSTKSPEPTIHDKDPEEFLHLVKDVLNIVEQVVNVTLTVGVKSTQDLEKVLFDIQRALVTLSDSLADFLNAQIYQKLEEIKKNSTADIVKLINCFEDREEEVKQIPITFINDTTYFVIKYVDDILKTFVTIQLDLHGVEEDIRNVTKKLDNCENDAEMLLCTLEILAEIENILEGIPNKIGDNVKNALDLINNLKSYAVECLNNNISAMQVEAVEIYNGIVECTLKENSQ